MNDHIGGRIKSERKRMGMNQDDFADIAGTTRRSQTNYEKGQRSPDSNYLAAIASAGADVQYVLTGNRASSLQALDHSLLKVVVEAIEEALYENNSEMVPIKKAELIVAVYDLYADTDKQVDKAKVLRLVKTAA